MEILQQEINEMVEQANHEFLAALDNEDWGRIGSLHAYWRGLRDAQRIVQIAASFEKEG